MPKLTPKKFRLGVGKNVDYLVRWYFDHPESEFKKDPKWRKFAEKLIEKEEVRDALHIVYDKVWEREQNKPKRGGPAPIWTIIASILIKCARLGTLNEDGALEIFQSKDEIRELARDIRKIKNRTGRLVGRNHPPEQVMFYENAKGMDKNISDLLTDDQVMSSLDILAGYFDCWDEHFKKGYGFYGSFSGIRFLLPKGKGKRRDVLECTLIYSLRGIFVDNTGEPLSPVIAALRNATFPKKKPINGRRVREMLDEIDKDPNCIKYPSVGYLGERTYVGE